MIKKSSIILVSTILVLPALLPLFYLYFVPETRVCGVDNKNYPSLGQAKVRGIEISYEFPCEFPNKEDSLYERYEEITFTGMLLDFYEGGDYSHFYIRDNFNSKEYFVKHIPPDTLEINKFLPGDQIYVFGRINKNTQVVQASNIVNRSLAKSPSETIDCQVSSIDVVQKTLECKSSNIMRSYKYDTNTRIIAGLNNQASINDILVNDKIRLRPVADKKIGIILLKERENTKYLKNHFFEAKLIFESFRDINGKREINIGFKTFPISLADLDIEAKELAKSMEVLDNTRIVKKYFGKLNLDKFESGDNLYLVGKAGDDGRLQAITIKNNSIWK